MRAMRPRVSKSMCGTGSFTAVRGGFASLPFTSRCGLNSTGKPSVMCIMATFFLPMLRTVCEIISSRTRPVSTLVTRITTEEARVSGAGSSRI